MINWNNFKKFNSDYNDSFENLCRLIFKHKYIGDISYNLNSAPNNPGIECEPVLIVNLLVGF